MSGGFFITGTDTGVGKTLIACALLEACKSRGLSAVGMKPVAAGHMDGRWEDVEALVASSGISAPRQWVNPYALAEPIAPHIAAAREGRRIELGVLCAAFSELKKLAEIVVVEGAGGFAVPLNEDETMADLAVRLGLPVILVVGLRLGCLNHALLTAEAVRSRGLCLAGWVANQIVPEMPALRENLETLNRRLDAPCLGVIPFLEAPHPAAVAPRLVTTGLFK